MFRLALLAAASVAATTLSCSTPSDFAAGTVAIDDAVPCSVDQPCENGDYCLSGTECVELPDELRAALEAVDRQDPQFDYGQIDDNDYGEAEDQQQAAALGLPEPDDAEPSAPDDTVTETDEPGPGDPGPVEPVKLGLEPFQRDLLAGLACETGTIYRDMLAQLDASPQQCPLVADWQAKTPKGFVQDPSMILNQALSQASTEEANAKAGVLAAYLDAQIPNLQQLCARPGVSALDVGLPFFYRDRPTKAFQEIPGPEAMAPFLKAVAEASFATFIANNKAADPDWDVKVGTQRLMLNLVWQTIDNPNAPPTVGNLYPGDDSNGGKRTVGQFVCNTTLAWYGWVRDYLSATYPQYDGWIYESELPLFEGLVANDYGNLNKTMRRIVNAIEQLYTDDGKVCLGTSAYADAARAYAVVVKESTKKMAESMRLALAGFGLEPGTMDKVETISESGVVDLDQLKTWSVITGNKKHQAGADLSGDKYYELNVEYKGLEDERRGFILVYKDADEPLDPKGTYARNGEIPPLNRPVLRLVRMMTWTGEPPARHAVTEAFFTDKVTIAKLKMLEVGLIVACYIPTFLGGPIGILSTVLLPIANVAWERQFAGTLGLDKETAYELTHAAVEGAADGLLFFGTTRKAKLAGGALLAIITAGELYQQGPITAGGVVKLVFRTIIVAVALHHGGSAATQPLNALDTVGARPPLTAPRE